LINRAIPTSKAIFAKTTLAIERRRSVQCQPGNSAA
jgi:hypothetical protein